MPAWSRRKRNLETCKRFVRCVFFVAMALLMSGSADPLKEMTFEEVMSEAVLARNNGEFGRAIELLKQAHSMRPDPKLLNNLGKMLEQVGRYREAHKTYSLVADDPNADSSLRGLDAARVAALTPKLGKAWVVAEVSPPDATLYVRGSKIEVPFGDEFAVKPGQNTLEFASSAGDAVVLRFTGFPVDIRTKYKENLAKGADTDALLSLEGMQELKPAPVALTVNMYDVQTDMATLGSIRMSAGRYRIQVKFSEGKPMTVQMKMSPGKKYVLAKTLSKGLAKRAEKLREANSGIVRGMAAGKSGVWPYVTTGAGAVLVGTGAAFMFMGKADENKVLNASTSADGTVTGLPMEEAQALEDSAAQKKSIGAALVSVGAVAAVGGAVWWFLDQPVADTKAKSSALGPVVHWAVLPNGLVLGGRF